MFTDEQLDQLTKAGFKFSTMNPDYRDYDFVVSHPDIYVLYNASEFPPEAPVLSGYMLGLSTQVEITTDSTGPELVGEMAMALKSFYEQDI